MDSSAATNTRNGPDHGSQPEPQLPGLSEAERQKAVELIQVRLTCLHRVSRRIFTLE